MISSDSWKQDDQCLQGQRSPTAVLVQSTTAAHTVSSPAALQHASPWPHSRRHTARRTLPGADVSCHGQRCQRLGSVDLTVTAVYSIPGSRSAPLDGKCWPKQRLPWAPRAWSPAHWVVSKELVVACWLNQLITVNPL